MRNSTPMHETHHALLQARECGASSEDPLQRGGAVELVLELACAVEHDTVEVEEPPRHLCAHVRMCVCVCVCTCMHNV